MIVRSAVEKVLHEKLPESYDRFMFMNKCDHIFDMMVRYAKSGHKWAA
jgi:type I restriction enzyme R subunit